MRACSVSEPSAEQAWILRTLDRLWRELEVPFLSRKEIEECIAAIAALVRDEDDEPWDPDEVPWQDGIAALAYSFRCLATGSSQEAAWAARRVYEALDCYVTQRDSTDVSSAEGERRVLADPLVQAELIRQQRDLDALGRLTDARDLANALGGFRERANAEARIILGACTDD